MVLLLLVKTTLHTLLPKHPHILFSWLTMFFVHVVFVVVLLLLFLGGGCKKKKCRAETFKFKKPAFLRFRLLVLLNMH